MKDFTFKDSLCLSSFACLVTFLPFSAKHLLVFMHTCSCVSAASSVFDDTAANQDGWKLADVLVLVLHIAKKSGISDLTLGKLLEIIAILVNVRRNISDTDTCPNSVFRLKSFLGITPSEHHQVTYFCPNSAAKRVTGQIEKLEERCGFRLRSSDKAGFWWCDLCAKYFSDKLVNQDGNHFVSIPIHQIMTNVMGRFGKFTSSLEPEAQSTCLNDVVDGSRYKKMGVTKKDLVILKHYDGGKLSCSTTKKLYLSFVQCVNIPLARRLPIWNLQMAWCGDELPRDRECFLVDDTKYFKQVQAGNDGSQPVKWIDRDGIPVESSVYAHSIAADTPERNALSGQCSHTSAQGYLYCEQIAVWISGRMTYTYVIALFTQEFV
jgi:hypothetical protein